MAVFVVGSQEKSLEKVTVRKQGALMARYAQATWRGNHPAGNKRPRRHTFKRERYVEECMEIIMYS